MKKSKPSGNQLDAQLGWREYAAIPLPHINVSLSGPDPDPICTLEEDGVVIGTWRKSDVPWLYDYLERRLFQLHGAWHLARTHLARITVNKANVPGAIAARKKQVEAKKANDAKRAKELNLQNEADYMRFERPEMPIGEIRARLKERHPDVTRSMLREIKVRRARRKVPRP